MLFDTVMDYKNHQVTQRTSSGRISDLKLKSDQVFAICPKTESVSSVYLPCNDILISGRSLTLHVKNLLCREGKQIRLPQVHSCLTFYESVNRKISGAKYHLDI